MPIELLGEVYTTTIAILAILNIGTCVYLWVTRRVPGWFETGCFALAVAHVCVMFHLLTNTTSAEAGYAYARLRFLGLSLVNPLLLILLLQYTRQTQWLKPPIVAGLLVIPVLTQIVLWLTPAHNSFFGGWELVRVGEHAFEQSDLGGWYYVHGYYGGVLLLFSLILLTWYMRQVDSSRRRELVILFGLAVFSSVGVANLFTLGPEPGFRLTPIALGLTSLLFIWLLYGRSGERVIPVAYDLVFVSIDEAALVTDPEGLVLRANPAAQRLLHRTNEALFNRPLDTIMGGVDGWRPAATAVEPFDITVDSAAGPVVCRVERHPMVRAGMTLGHVVVLRDITAELKAFELSLEQERSRVLVAFIADASHEFRTPLSIIKTSAYLLGKVAQSEQATRYLGNINTQVDRVNLLVDDLQTMSTQETTAPLVAKPADLPSLVRDVLNGFARPLARARNISIEHDFEAGLPRVPVNEDDFTLALRKLLDNAVRYTSEGGSIRVTARLNGAAVLVAIHDTGAGMDEATLKAAPTRFYRGDAAHSTAGFGLGLPIAQRIAERHGGALILDSEPGQGTTATLRLPLTPPA